MGEKRWTILSGRAVEAICGPWVKHDDYATLRADNDRLEELFKGSLYSSRVKLDEKIKALKAVLSDARAVVVSDLNDCCEHHEIGSCEECHHYDSEVDCGPHDPPKRPLLKRIDALLGDDGEATT